MKLWLLQPRDDVLEDDNPWHPLYDKVFGFVVRAQSERRAHAFATEQARNEVDEALPEARKDAWLNAAFSTCVELTAEGEPGVILRDFAGV